MTEAQNLDCMDRRELSAMAGDCKVPPAYRLYARMAVSAMDDRKRGEITAALSTERNMQRIYNRLPTSLKW